MKKFVRDLIALGACEDALTFVGGYPTFGAAWAACTRPDWMLWRLGRGLGAVDRAAGFVLLADIWAQDATRSAARSAATYATYAAARSADAAYAAGSAADAADAATYAADAADAATYAATYAAACAAAQVQQCEDIRARFSYFNGQD